MSRALSMFAAALSVYLLGAPAGHAAVPYLYDCDMNRLEQGRGWISPKIALVFPGDGTVKIVDAITLYFNKEPLLGIILRDNGRRLIVKWTIKGAKTDSGHSFANFDYRASIAKASGKMELTAAPRESDSGVRSHGTCRRRTK